MHSGRAGYPLPTAGTDWRAGRTPVLAYGSNVCPSKITWLRDELGLTGDVVVVRAGVSGLAAVWASGFRARDGSRPATLAAAPGVFEWHGVWFATPEQVGVLDVCEGRGVRYDLAELHSGEVRLADGTPLEKVFAYVGAGPERLPLLVDGAPVRMTDVPQDNARRLHGVPATTHGMDVTVIPS